MQQTPRPHSPRAIFSHRNSQSARADTFARALAPHLKRDHLRVPLAKCHVMIMQIAARLLRVILAFSPDLDKYVASTTWPCSNVPFPHMEKDSCRFTPCAYIYWACSRSRASPPPTPRKCKKTRPRQPDRYPISPDRSSSNRPL